MSLTVFFGCCRCLFVFLPSYFDWALYWCLLSSLPSVTLSLHPLVLALSWLRIRCPLAVTVACLSIYSQLFHGSVRQSTFRHETFDSSACWVSDTGLWSPGKASWCIFCSSTNWSLRKEMCTMDTSMLQVCFTVACPIENFSSFTAAMTHRVFSPVGYGSLIHELNSSLL